MKALLALPEVFLCPGEMHFATAPGRIGTLLGSCVAITAWHPQSHFGGMCHIVLPYRRNRPFGASPDGRYADEAVECFAYELRARRISTSDCQIKLFGGGNMLTGRSAGFDVGLRNVQAARQALQHYGFQVLIEQVGGFERRRLFLDLATGFVWLSLPSKAGERSGHAEY